MWFQDLRISPPLQVVANVKTWCQRPLAVRLALFALSTSKKGMISASCPAKENTASTRNVLTLGFSSCPVRVLFVATVRQTCRPSRTPLINNDYSSDFLALENMLSGQNLDEVEDESEPADSQTNSARDHINLNQGRFSRYLRFARRRRHGDESDPTDPYMPTAPETSIYSGM